MAENTSQLQSAVEIAGLTKTFGKRRAVSNATFTMQPSQVLGLVGPNGAGKTTLLRMMVGLLHPTGGTVRLFGHDVQGDFERALASVGAIIESPDMYKFLTGRQNLAQYARMRGDIPDARIDEVVQFVDLSDRINEKITRYSLGMRQRLGIAQALLHNPKLLILDEPTNGLDPAGMADLRRMVRRLADEQGTAVIVSSHLLHDIEAICDSIAVMQAGEVVGSGPMSQFVGASTPAYRLTFETTSGGPAEIAARSGWGVSLSEDNLRNLIVESDKLLIADLNAMLVSAGVRVCGIEPMRRSLEDAFLRLTGGAAQPSTTDQCFQGKASAQL